MQRLYSFVPIRGLTIVIALAIAFSVLGGTGLTQSPDVEPQDPANVFEAATLAVADPDTGEIGTYDITGTPTAPPRDQSYGSDDAIAFGFARGAQPRDQNFGCVIVARASSDVIDMCVNQDLIIQFTEFEYSPGDGLAMGPALGPEGSSDEIVVGRADTGMVEIWDFTGEVVEPIEVVKSFDGEFTSSSSIHVVEEFRGHFGAARDEGEIVIIDHDTSEVRVYQYSNVEENFRLSDSLEIPNSIVHDDVVIGDMDPVGFQQLVTVNATTGQATVFDYDFGEGVSVPNRLTEVETIDTGYSDGDAIALADVHANTSDSILIANANSGLLEVYSYTFDREDRFHEVQSLDIDITPDAELAVFPIHLSDISGDGIRDIWKTHGLDANGDGQIDVDLQAMGADPLEKDLFIEVDWTFAREPDPDALEMVVESFALAPVDAGGVDTPSGNLGINLHIDTGNLGGGNQLVDENNQSWNRSICELSDDANDSGVADFYEAKRLNFDPLRTLVFRYAISADSCIDSPAGQAEIGGNDFIVFNASHPLTIVGAGTFMHELGHNLNLHHGGFERDNCKPNYVSIMSYSLPSIERTDGSRIIDFSPPRIDEQGNRSEAPLPALDENALDETITLDPEDPVNMFVFQDGNDDTQVWPLNEQVDWLGDDEHSSDPVQVNIDNVPTVIDPAEDDCLNDELTVLQGSDDWSNISMPFLHNHNAADGPINPSHPHRDTDDIIEYMKSLNDTDLEIAKSGAPESVIAGEELVYTLTVTNNGPRRAIDVHMIDELPNEVTYLESTSDCSEANGTVTCDIGLLEVDDHQEIDLKVEVNPDTVFNAGGATTITNHATVVSHDDFARELDVDSARVEIETEVTGESDLEAVELIAPDDAVDVLLDQPTQVGLEKTIANHGPSGPTDVALDIATDSAPTVNVDLIGPEEVEALDVNEQRGITETLEVSCTEPGIHTITLTNSISPATPGVTDPDGSNAQVTADLAVECVVPVAINIKPGGFPNPINLNTRGLIPVAVLSTDAGEYGLPIDFDATKIDPTTVRFGRSDDLFGTSEPAGAPAFQDRGHIEDAYELDQETKDGVLDMVLRFRTQETGLIETDTQACLRGEVEDSEESENLTFFGCGEIEIRP